MKIAALGLLAGATILSGCQVCQTHPTGCLVAGVIVAGSLAAEAEMLSSRHSQPTRGKIVIGPCYYPPGQLPTTAVCP